MPEILHPDPHYVSLPDDFPMHFFIKVRHSRSGPYVAIPHVHNCLEIGYCHEGSGVFVIADKILPFKASDVVVIHPAEPHYGQNAEGVTSVWTWIFADPFRLARPGSFDHDVTDISRFCGSGFNNILSTQKYPGIEQLLELIINEEQSRRPYYRSALRGYVLALLAVFHRVPGGTRSARRLALPQGAAHSLGPALQYIHEHFGEPLTLDVLAQRCFLSTSHFRKLFKQVLGKTPYQFLLDYRISMAMSELRTGAKTCSAIAADHGFPSLSSFVRKFKDLTGVSPRSWAKRE